MARNRIDSQGWIHDVDIRHLYTYDALAHLFDTTHDTYQYFKIRYVELYGELGSPMVDRATHSCTMAYIDRVSHVKMENVCCTFRNLRLNHSGIITSSVKFIGVCKHELQQKTIEDTIRFSIRASVLKTDDGIELIKRIVAIDVVL